MQQRRIESFLIRLVIDDQQQSSDPEQWRGRIQHIATGQELQIDRLNEAIAFINALLEAHQQAPADPDAAQPHRPLP